MTDHDADAPTLNAHGGAHAVQEGCALLEARHVLIVDKGRVRVRDRHVLRYYARMIQHLLTPRAPQTD